jgi:para-aminobenzoate synthetase component 1
VTEPPALVAAVARRPLAIADPLALFEALRRAPYPWLLDSAAATHPLARFSFAGADPWAVLRAFVAPGGARIELEVRRAVRPDLRPGRRRLSGDPLVAARALLGPRPEAGADCELPFAGGAVGWLGYELASLFDRIELRAPDDLGLPDLALLFVDRLVAVDAARGEAFAVALGYGATAGGARGRAERAAQELAARVDAGARIAPFQAPLAPEPAAVAQSGLGAEGYQAAVRAIRERIARGDVYQACLAQRLEVPFEGDPYEAWRALRARNPAPFAAFLALPEVSLAGSSPERFLRVDPSGRVESRPIKGTRPRGDDPESDARMRRELETSAKERAENLMIVDLVRNDLGRVCETGSVHVPELFRIEAFATVFQLVSVVAGCLRPDRDVFDLVRASFPPGSMTGAPKLAAMRLLDALEPARRGPYAGALGWLDARGGAELSVVIRTALFRRGRAYVHAGGGVVADSEPRAEWQESLDKARAVLAALGAAPACAGPAAPAFIPRSAGYLEPPGSPLYPVDA